MIFFYSPGGENGYLSNAYESKFTYNDLEFRTAEQALMYMKAATFNDTETADRILGMFNFKDLRRIAREITGFSDAVWRSSQEKIMMDILTAKFSCNQNLWEKLDSTDNEILVNCDVRSGIWGIGIPMYDDRRLKMELWENKNLLGTCLMNARGILRGRMSRQESENKDILKLSALSSVESKFNRGICVEVCSLVRTDTLSVERIVNCESFEEISKKMQQTGIYKVFRIDIVGDVIHVYVTRI